MFGADFRRVSHGGVPLILEDLDGGGAAFVFVLEEAELFADLDGHAPLRGRLFEVIGEFEAERGDFLQRPVLFGGQLRDLLGVLGVESLDLQRCRGLGHRIAGGLLNGRRIGTGYRSSRCSSRCGRSLRVCAGRQHGKR